MTKEELLAKYNRVAEDKSQLQQFCQDVINGEIGGGGKEEIKIINLNEFLTEEQLGDLITVYTRGYGSDWIEANATFVTEEEFEKYDKLRLTMDIVEPGLQPVRVLDLILQKSTYLPIKTYTINTGKVTSGGSSSDCQTMIMVGASTGDASNIKYIGINAVRVNQE